MSQVITANTSLVTGMLTVEEKNPLKDINKLTNIQLKDTKVRLENLLKCKVEISNLSDKGSRIENTYQRVLAELKRREEIEDAASMFSKLNIVNAGEKLLTDIEWQNDKSIFKNDPNQYVEDNVEDSDDEEETDPLKIFAQRPNNKRTVKVLAPEPDLITKEDLQEIIEIQTLKQNVSDVIPNTINEKISTTKPEIDQGEEGTSETQLDKYAKCLIQMENQIVPQPEKFKPYKTTVSGVHDPQKERMRKKHKHWEVTSATPPLIEHNATQMLSLSDSCVLQTQIIKRMKEYQEQNARERLAARMERLQNMKISIPDKEKLKQMPAFSSYRDPSSIIEGTLVIPDSELSEYD